MLAQLNFIKNEIDENSMAQSKLNLIFRALLYFCINSGGLQKRVAVIISHDDENKAVE